MKKALILIGVVAVLIIGALFWLAASVGPDTAPTDVKSIDVEIDAR